MFEGMEPKDWVIALSALIGAIAGPFLAVYVTRMIDESREARERRNALFVALMATRRAFLTQEHVSAVNRIEVEFATDTRVLTMLRAYMNLLEDPYPTDDQKEAQQLLDRRRRRAFADLVQAMGQALGRRIDRLDIIEGGYHPGGWAETELLQLQNLRLMNAILRGNFGFPVSFVPFRSTGGPIRPPQSPAQPETQTPQGPQPGEPGSPFPSPPPQG